MRGDQGEELADYPSDAGDLVAQVLRVVVESGVHFSIVEVRYAAAHGGAVQVRLRLGRWYGYRAMTAHMMRACGCVVAMQAVGDLVRELRARQGT